MLVPDFARAWVDFPDERALERPKIQKNLQAFSGEQIFAHIQLQGQNHVTAFPFVISFHISKVTMF